MKTSSSIPIIFSLLVINAALSQAMLPPPILRAACGAFADAEEAVGEKAMAVGKAAVDMAMKPIAIVGGLKAAAVGTGMKLGGGAIKYVGSKMAADGALLEATGAGVKGAGLGVAALGLKPIAEKVVAAGKVAEGTVQTAHETAEQLAKKIGDTSIQIGATIDSPFIGHHHKQVSVTAGLDTALHQQQNRIEQQQVEQQVEQQVQQQEIQQQEVQQQIQQEAAVPKTKRAAKIDTDVMKSALNLVKEAKLEDCVFRAICDLNCNPQGFGTDGKQVFMNMVRLQGSNLLEAEESKLYHKAASDGRANSGKCDKCSTIYPKCKSQSSDLIKMASHIRMD